MTMLLCIDPGPTKSGWCIMNGTEIIGVGVWGNDELLRKVKSFPALGSNAIVIEKIASYGMPVGAEIFDTCIWIGRFIQAAALPEDVQLITRKNVKLELCGTARAKDANIRQAVIDRFPATGGGKIPQIGTKKEPGPLYEVKKDAWAAVALGIAQTTYGKPTWGGSNGLRTTC
jgi:hypothetical protein